MKTIKIRNLSASHVKDICRIAQEEFDNCLYKEQLTSGELQVLRIICIIGAMNAYEVK